MNILIFEKVLQIEAKIQVILFRSEVLKYLEDHYWSGLLSVWMNDQQKICTFWYDKYPKILLPWVSQIFQRFEQAGLSLVCFLSLKAAKSLHLCTEHPLPWTLLTLRQAGSQGTLGNCWVTDLDSEPSQDVHGCQTYDRKNAIKEKTRNKLSPDTASPSFKPQSCSLPFSLTPTQKHWQLWFAISNC